MYRGVYIDVVIFGHVFSEKGILRGVAFRETP